MTPMENDPLWKLRHALAGVALAITVTLATLLIVDQWDCFRGVPNCD